MVVVYTYYSYLLSPQLELLEQAREEYHSLEAEKSKQDKLLQNEPLLEKDQVQNQFKSLLNQVPADPCIPEAIAGLEEMAISSGVKLMGINYRKSVKAGPAENSSASKEYDFEDIQVQVKGDYHEIKIFIGLIEKDPRIYILSSSQFQTPIYAIRNTDEVGVARVSSGTNDSSIITAQIGIKLIYDHISMPGIVGEMEVNSAGRANPFRNQ